jgi:hypothetical protein
LYSNVPRLASTLSGVVIDGGISAAESGVSAPSGRLTIVMSFVFIVFER